MAEAKPERMPNLVWPYHKPIKNAKTRIAAQQVACCRSRRRPMTPRLQNGDTVHPFVSKYDPPVTMPSLISFDQPQPLPVGAFGSRRTSAHRQFSCAAFLELGKTQHGSRMSVRLGRVDYQAVSSAGGSGEY